MNAYFLILGFGYTAKFLAPRLKALGYDVIGTTRVLNNELDADPEIQLIEFASPQMEVYLAKATHVLVSIPPSSAGDLVLAEYADLITKHCAHLQWVGYLSSTGVYGDYKGEWVNEESACMPHTPSGIARLQAETDWLSFAKTHQLPLHVFRLAGIYGPGRNAVTRLQQGKQQSIFKEEQFFCRIHVEDIVSVLLASMNAINPLAIYNVADDEPAPAHIVDQYAAQLLHREPPLLVPISQASLSPMEREFYANNRKVSNAKIKKELGITLKYPTFREGLLSY